MDRTAEQKSADARLATLTHAELYAEATQNAAARAELSAEQFAMASSFAAVEKSLRAELASACAKLAALEPQVWSAADDELEPGSSLLFSRRDMGTQLHAATKARGSLADMLAERHRAYDALEAKYKELRQAHREQVRLTAAVEDELSRTGAAAASTEASLCTALAAVEDRLKNSESDYAQLDREAKAMAAAAKTDANVARELRHQIATLEESVAGLQQHVAAGSEQNAALETRMTDMVAQHQAEVTQQEEKQSVVRAAATAAEEDLRGELRRSKEAHDFLAAEHETMTAKLAVVWEDLATITESHGDVARRYDVLAAEHAALQGGVDEVQAAHDDIAAAKLALEAEVAQLSTNLSSSTAELKEQTESLCARLETTEMKLRDSETTVSARSAIIADMEAADTAARVRMQELSELNADLNHAAAMNRATESDMAARQADLEAQLTETAAKEDSLRTQLGKAKEEQATLVAEHDSLVFTLQEGSAAAELARAEALAEMESTLSTEAARAQQLLAANVALEQAQNESRAAAMESSYTISDMQGQISRATTTEQSLRNQLEKIRGAHTTLTTEYEEMAAAHFEAQSSLSRTSAKAESAEKRIAALRGQLETSVEARRAMSTEMASMAATLAATRTDLASTKESELGGGLRCKQLTAELATEKEFVQKMQQALNESHATNDRTEEERSALASQVASLSATVATMETREESLRSRLEETEAQLLDTEAALTSLELESESSMQTVITSTAARQHEMAEANAKIQAEAIEARVKLAEEEASLAHLQTEGISKIEQLSAQHSEFMAELNGKCEMLEASRYSLETELSRTEQVAGQRIARLAAQKFRNHGVAKVFAAWSHSVASDVAERTRERLSRAEQVAEMRIAKAAAQKLRNHGLAKTFAAWSHGVSSDIAERTREQEMAALIASYESRSNLFYEVAEDESSEAITSLELAEMVLDMRIRRDGPRVWVEGLDEWSRLGELEQMAANDAEPLPAVMDDIIKRILPLVDAHQEAEAEAAAAAIDAAGLSKLQAARERWTSSSLKRRWQQRD